jgi:hypothetical protein
VGDTATPVCAVETWLACFARLDAEFCARVAPHVNILFHPEAKPHLIEYQISAVLTPWSCASTGSVKYEQRALFPTILAHRPKSSPGEDPYLVGLWRTGALGLLISNMEGMVQAARACREKG